MEEVAQVVFNLSFETADPTKGKIALYDRNFHAAGATSLAALVRQFFSTGDVYVECDPIDDGAGFRMHLTSGRGAGISLKSMDGELRPGDMYEALMTQKPPTFLDDLL